MTERKSPQWPPDADAFSELRDATMGVFAVLGQFKLSRTWTPVVPRDSEFIAEHAEVALNNLGFLAVAKQAINDHLSVAAREDLCAATMRARVKRPAAIPDSQDCCPSYARRLAGELLIAVFQPLRDMGVELSYDAFTETDDWDAMLSAFSFEDMESRRIIDVIDDSVESCAWLEEIDVPALHAFTIREFAALRVHLGMADPNANPTDQEKIDAELTLVEIRRQVSLKYGRDKTPSKDTLRRQLGKNTGVRGQQTFTWKWSVARERLHDNFPDLPEKRQ